MEFDNNEYDNILDYIQKVFGKSTAKMNILDRQIPLEFQMEYMETAEKISEDSKGIINSKDKNTAEILSKKLTNSTDESGQRKLLIILAKLKDVKAFRVIENFEKQSIGDMKNWAYLALKEARMSLESFFLEENSVLVASGLGGKGNLLRFFVVFVNQGEIPFTDIQKKQLEKELQFHTEETLGELESVEFSDRFAKILILLPLNLSLKNFFKKILHSCNEMAISLNKSYLLTNVKILQDSDIEQFINKKK